MGSSEAAELARAAFARRAWAEAYVAFGQCADLDAPDLEAAGLAAFLIGDDEQSVAIRERAHHAYLAADDGDGAARTAFWLGLSLLLGGEPARGFGWFGRMRSVVAEPFDSSVWSGYASFQQGMAALFSGEADTALGLFESALRLASRYDDLDLRLMAASGHGQALLTSGRMTEGRAELDEVMVLATSSPANPQVVGQVYCAVIAVCRGCLDLGRGAEWTEVLSRWCDAQPDLVPYRGQCLVHRSEVLQIRGRWDDAVTEAQKVLDREAVSGRDVATGMALYQRAELYRLRGDHRAAERAYRDALAAGQDPQPGLALLRLAQGKTESAVQALQRALVENPLVFFRARLLPALVEAALALGDLEAAESAARDLVDLARGLDSAYARAFAATSLGAVALGRERPDEALTHLRSALAVWAELDAPYDAARCRVLLARACRTLGDGDTAEMELATARRTFTDLGAKADLAALDGTSTPAAPAGLTPREIEVLGLVATGASNRDIAAQLVLSERTVARHVANIFVKIGVSTRAAATAYAYDQGLV